VTGVAGLIGGVLRERLGDRYELSGLDLNPVQGVRSFVGDLADIGSIRPAFEGQETVVHLGADSRGEAPWDSVLRNNILGTHNVMEAAREAGVRRVVFASSNHVVGYIPEKVEPYKSIFDARFGDVRRPFPLLATDLIRPCCFYAVSKAFGEALGSFYHDKYGMSFIALRIGGVLMEEGWHLRSPGGLAMLLSHRDAAQLIQRSIDAPPSVGFTIVYGISDNAMRIHEIETAESVLGYHPQDNAGEELDPERGPHVSQHDLAHPE
jgi:nucleoside-diphosphate-sugar epimerase